MKKFYIYIVLLCFTITANAQFYPQEGFLFYNNNNFSISNYTPFGLSYATPLPIRQEGYSQLNDSLCPNSPVIFSTDGINVYRGSDGVIVQTGLLGTGGPGFQNSTNAATIVPIAPTSTGIKRALIITTKWWNSPNNEAYHSLLEFNISGTPASCNTYAFNMPAATKNLQLTSFTGVTSIAEKVTVLKIPSSNDYWLLMHEATNTGGGSGKFLVFRIIYATGVINAVNDYSVGLPVRKIGGKGQMQGILGQVPGLGSAYFIGAAYFVRPGSLAGATDFLYMNPATGALSLRETILYGFFRRPYGLEFSRSSDYLYVSYRNMAQTMTRYYNYAGGTVASTAITNAFLAPTPLRTFGQLQRTDNDAIYSPLFNSGRLLYVPVSSSPTSFPSSATTTSGSTIFRFGLPNYWRN
jgi:hypothetical protein